MAARGLILLACIAAAAATEVTPIDKVISLIEGMKTDLEKDSKTEAQAYDKYACFCRDTTKAKSTSVTDGHDTIDAESSDIADKTQAKKTDSTELGKRKTNQEQLSAKLEATNSRCAKEKAEYEAEAADMNKAISSLGKAIKAMKDSKPSLLQADIHEELMETLAVADAMSMITTPKRKAVTAMIQGQASVDPEDPDFKYHSNDIIDLLVKLEGDFKGEKKTLDSEYNKAKKACDELKASLKKEMGSNKDAMNALEKNIDKLSKEIAEHRENLVEAEAVMKDDELYLKDLTAQCEARAKDWDQRSAMRNNELTALTQALEILTKNVKDRADEVNARALLIQKLHKPDAAPVPVKDVKPASNPAPKQTTKTSVAVKKAISFLQANSDSSDEDRKNQALALLTREGQRLESFALTSLAQRSAADPFKKIKGLIQKLIERLVAEATAEATKKGFCDTELGKARKDRDYRREETTDLSAELESLEAKEDALTEEIKQLTNDIKDETKALTTTTKDRKEEKEANMKTLKTAKEGYEAVNEALLVLKSFYKQAAKASLIQASPVDEDTSGPGFSGSYKGNQSGSQAVLSLLETISSDFDRTIRTTEAAEETAHREFVEFSQASKSSIASKTTKKELDEQDLETTKNSLETKMNDLETAQKLLDDALKELEDLKPTCIDTGMSYKERVEKREEEIAALTKGLCILDPKGVESECSGK
jgi:uncharacterized protein YlxW (UPF0749 family)